MTRRDAVAEALAHYGGATFTAPMIADRAQLTRAQAIRALHDLARAGRVERVPVGRAESNRFHWREVRDSGETVVSESTAKGLRDYPEREHKFSWIDGFGKEVFRDD